MAHQARHDRVQVNHHQGFTGVHVEEDVVDLGVVMGHAQGQFPRVEHIGQPARLILHGQEPIQLFPDFRHAAAGIGLHILDQRFIALAGVVEIGDGVIQAAGVKIAQHHLEFAEGLARVAHHAQIVAGVERDGGHVIADAPEAAVVVHQVGFPAVLLARVMVMQAHLVRLFFPDVLRHQVDVFHQLNGIAERVGIYPLHQIAFDHRHARAVVPDVIGLVGTVHVALADFLVGKERAFQMKPFPYLLQFSRHLLIHGLSSL